MVIFILRYIRRRIRTATESEGEEVRALVTEVLPSDYVNKDGTGTYLLKLEVFLPEDDEKISLDRVPYKITEEHVQEVSLVRACATVTVKINPVQNNELYVRKGTLAWGGETDLNAMRVKLGGEPEKPAAQ
jgi:hypothetical protein